MKENRGRMRGSQFKCGLDAAWASQQGVPNVFSVLSEAKMAGLSALT
jgi:hypothetical protein